MAETETKQIVEYNVSDEAISQLRDQYDGLTAETPEKYEECRLAIANVRDLRVKVEKTRKELKADALAYGRKVDAEAKRITAKLTEIEEPLKLEKAKIDDEKARKKREKEEAEQRAREEAARIEREKREAEERAERERIKAEQEAERKALEAEREKLAKERAEHEAKLQAERDAAAERERIAQEKLAKEREAAEAKQREEQAKLEEDRRKVAAERERLERIAFERQAKERAEREAREAAERKEAERLRILELAEQETKRREAMKPDVEKVRDFAKTLADIVPPNLESEEAKSVIESSQVAIGNIVWSLENWCGENHFKQTKQRH